MLIKCIVSPRMEVLSMNPNTDVLILSAGRVASDIASVVGDIPSGMVPLKGKPAIAWIIDGLLEQGFERFVVSVGFRKEPLIRFLESRYAERCVVTIVEVDFRLAPGNSLLSGLAQVKSPDVLVVLGDTILREPLVLKESVVYTSARFNDPTKWCLVRARVDGQLWQLYDKQDVEGSDLRALIGVYYFRDAVALQRIGNALDPSARHEISELLLRYNAVDPIRCVEERAWLDIGHLETYHRAKIACSGARQFNALSYDPLQGVITKQSTNEEKLRDEIHWYKNVPASIALFAPRLVAAVEETPMRLSLEYYGYPTLAELFVYGNLHVRIWNEIVQKVVRILLLFQEHPGEVTKADYEQVYLRKTRRRIATLTEKDPTFRELLSAETITVNDEPLANLERLWPFIERTVERLYGEGKGQHCFLHGDFCFSNILFDPTSGVVRLIDPRGRWGSSSSGDLRYDAAKLRHSASGLYDHIVHDFFVVRQDGDAIELRINANGEHAAIADALDRALEKYWDLNEIRFIEGLLFLSMLPLHPERQERQLAMYATGLKLLNDVKAATEQKA